MGFFSNLYTSFFGSSDSSDDESDYEDFDFSDEDDLDLEPEERQDYELFRQNDIYSDSDDFDAIADEQNSESLWDMLFGDTDGFGFSDSDE